MKLSHKTLDKALEICTGKEINLLINLGQYQDAQGVIGGIHYRNIIQDAAMSESAFYKCLHSLEKKGVIAIDWQSEHGYWKVKIQDNAFSNKEDYKKGYLNLNYKILHSDKFKAASRSEKVIILKIIKLMNYYAGKSHITLRFETLMDWTGRSLRSVKVIVRKLLHLIPLTIECSKITIALGHTFSLPNRRKNIEADVRNGHIVAYIMNKTRTVPGYEDFIDTLAVLRQYGVNCFEKVKGIIGRSAPPTGNLCLSYVFRFGFTF